MKLGIVPGTRLLTIASCEHRARPVTPSMPCLIVGKNKRAAVVELTIQHAWTQGGGWCLVPLWAPWVPGRTGLLPRVGGGGGAPARPYGRHPPSAWALRRGLTGESPPHSPPPFMERPRARGPPGRVHICMYAHVMAYMYLCIFIYIYICIYTFMCCKYMCTRPFIEGSSLIHDHFGSSCFLRICLFPLSPGCPG